jgi:ATP-dependent metalloprotease FtsH
MTENKNKKPLDKDQKPKNESKINPWLVYGLISGIFIILLVFNHGAISSKKITINALYSKIEAGDVEKIIVNDEGIAEIYFTDVVKEKIKKETKDKQKNIFNDGTGPDMLVENIGDLKLFQEKLEKAVVAKKIKDYDFVVTSKWFESLVGMLLPILFLVAIWVIIMRKMSGGMGGGQIFSIGKSRAKLFDNTDEKRVTFKDVAGLEGAKEEVQEIVEFLKTPEKFTNLGGKIPKGALLVGPPGTGKTLLAKAVAGEADVPFFSLSGSDFVEMFVGVGASRVRDLFKQAKEKAPSIIFIDEIDAVGRARGKNAMSGANDERESTLNQLLTEMDGFGTNTAVIVLAATNRAEILDKALLRAGRFDRQIYVDLPDLNERKEIFEVHLKNIKSDENLDKDFLAKQTPGFSGADIANVCNEAALTAARKNKESVDKQDFLDAVDRIIGGLEKKNKIITPSEKKAIAVHEAGHATVSWLLEYAAPLIKVTIVPRGQSLGAAWYLPEERQIVRAAQMLDEMCATMGGRAAEKVVFDQISTGALSDLEKVTKQARAMVTIYGLNEKLGNITYYDSSGQSEYNFSKPYSEDTAKMIDEEIKQIIENEYQRAINLLTENKDKLLQLADLLIEKEVIFKDDLENIFGKRPFEKDFAEEKNDIEINVTNENFLKN